MNAIPYLNLGDAQAPTSAYLATGRPTPEALELFARRPQRALAIMEMFNIAGYDERALVADFHVNERTERGLDSQLVDMSERIAAMTSARPQRPALPMEKIVGILRDLGAKGIFNAELAEACATSILKDNFQRL